VVVTKRKQERQRLRVRSSDRPDPWIVALTSLFLITGILLVFDTTFWYSEKNYDDGYRMIIKHGVSVVLGLIGMWSLSRFRSDLLERYSKPLFVVAAAMLLLPLVPGLGTCTKGACRWVNLGPMNFQPAEFAKIAFVVYVAAALTRKAGHLRDWRYGLGPTCLVMGILATLLMLQPDFGTAVLVCLLGAALMFLAGVPAWQLGGLGALGAAAMGVAIMLEPYRLKRMLCFLNPDEDPSGACYQLIQSYRAFGSGGIGGIGVGASRQKSGWLPEAHSDFVFAVIGEEAGLIGACVIVILFALLAYRGLRIANRHPDAFGQLLAAGVTLAIALQALINMGVVIGLLPTKGLALPFLSYGGSSMLVSLAFIGILMSLSRELRER
jgi:cell division protein FtsW